MITDLHDNSDKMTGTLGITKQKQHHIGKVWNKYMHDSFLNHTFLSWHCNYGGLWDNDKYLSQF